MFFIMSYSDVFNYFKPYKLVVSPPISGTVLKYGEPIDNIEVTLLAGFSQYYERTTMTDKDGRFHFEPIIHRQWFKPLSINTNLIGIQITANINNNQVLMWSSHTGLDIHDYVIDNLENLECDLDDSSYEYHFKNRVVPNGREHSVFGICRLRGYDEKIHREDL
ncbi:DUF6795 domain-containing protein [Vibrio harveyi]